MSIKRNFESFVLNCRFTSYSRILLNLDPYHPNLRGEWPSGLYKIWLKSLLVLRARGNHPTSRKSANGIPASNLLRQNQSFVMKFLVPSQKLKYGNIRKTNTSWLLPRLIYTICEIFVDISSF